MKSYIYFITIIFTLLLSCTNGADDTGGKSSPKPPVEDKDKITYAENMLDFSRVPLKQYLAQSQNNETCVENYFDIFLNLGSAKGLEPQKYLETSYDINMAVELNNKDVTNTILVNPICKLTYNGDHACKIIFKPIKTAGIYTLKFSYQGININKQILLHVATRTGWFDDNQKNELHILGVNYNVNLQLKSNLPADDLKIPLTYTEDTICIKQIGDKSAKDQGTECIQNPKCEYSPQSGDLPRSCNITYQLLKGGENHPLIQVNTTDYFRKFEVLNYQPLTCLREGLELIKSKEDPKSIGTSIFLDSKSKEPKFFTAYYCAFNQTSEATKDLKLDVNNIQPNNVNFKDALRFSLTNKDGTVKDFPIGGTLSIENGSYNIIHVQYNPQYKNPDELHMFGTANVGFVLTDGNSHSIGAADFTLMNPSRIKYLRMNTVSNSIDNEDIAKDTTSLVFKSHNLENNKELFIKPHNLSYPGQSTLIMKTCFIQTSGITPLEYESEGNDPYSCLVKYEYTDAKNKKQIATLDDANITVGYYSGDRLVSLPRGAIPAVAKAEDLLKLKEGEMYTIYIDATGVYPDLKSHLQLKFYEQDTDNRARAAEHFTSGDLDISLEAQDYLVDPSAEKNLLAFTANNSDHADKFYMRVRPGNNSSFKAHKIRLKIDKDSSNGNFTIKAYHMEKQESLENPLVMADNCIGDSCNNQCILAEKGAVAGKYCECTIPEKGTTVSDTIACNFELVSYGQKVGDYVQFVLVDEKDRSISDQILSVKYKDGGGDMNMSFDKLAPTFNFFDGTTIKNAVIFPEDKVTHVIKKGNDWDEAIFNPNAFFNSRVNMFSKNGSITIINYPGKLNYETQDISNSVFSIWTNSGKMSGQDLESLTCKVSAGTIHTSHKDSSGSETAWTRYVMPIYSIRDSDRYEEDKHTIDYHSYKDIPYLAPDLVTRDAGSELADQYVVKTDANQNALKPQHSYFLYSWADQDFKVLWQLLMLNIYQCD